MILDLARVDVLAAGHDRVLEPVDDVEVALLREGADVAGVRSSRRAAPPPSRRGRPSTRRTATGRAMTISPSSPGRQRLVVLVDDAHLLEIERARRGEELRLLVGILVRRVRYAPRTSRSSRTSGRSRSRTASRRGAAPRGRWVSRRRGRPRARRGRPRRCRVLVQDVDHRRHEHHVRAAVALDRLEHLAGTKARIMTFVAPTYVKL